MTEAALLYVQDTVWPVGINQFNHSHKLTTQQLHVRNLWLQLKSVRPLRWFDPVTFQPHHSFTASHHEIWRDRDFPIKKNRLTVDPDFWSSLMHHGFCQQIKLKSKERNVWSWEAYQRLDDHLLNESGIKKKKEEKSVKPFSARCRVFQGGWCRNRWGRRRSLDRRGAWHCRSTEILKQGKKQEIQIQLTALFSCRAHTNVHKPG